MLPRVHQRGCEGQLVNFAVDNEYDLKYVFNPGDNIVGMSLSTQDITARAAARPHLRGRVRDVTY